jgi:hypothetical protein
MGIEAGLPVSSGRYSLHKSEQNERESEMDIGE